MSQEDEIKSEAVDNALNEMNLLDHAPVSSLHIEIAHDNHGAQDSAPTPQRLVESRSSSPVSSTQSPMKKMSATQTPKSEDERGEVVNAEVSVKVENGRPKLARKASQKMVSRAPQLFDHVPDATEEATSQFQVITDCMYGSKYMGSSEHDALGCDCSGDFHNGQNNACGEDSDCINRATKMECIDDECNCGVACQNQRFQRKQYAKVSVIKTEKKGFGLRADTDLQANDFIFEYVGEVINEPVFRKRTIAYDESGIKHFYFMSLTKSEFVDATKKGNLGRFCNHSCNPNCYVDKWVVGDKLRMGIFAERNVKAGEELVFNYNVDRYGADPQPCYCNEPNCTGFIGGKTQTERATKLSHATIEALGIEDGDGWDTAVAKKPRKKKTGEDDEEYVNNVQPRGLDEDGVTKVMATLMQCKEKWIAVKLLNRIQRCDDDRVRNRVVRMHGYQILRTVLTTFGDDNNVILQVLDILWKLPRLTRNKIADAKIEPALVPLADSVHEDIKLEATRLLEEWGKLETAYRIPRKKFDPNAQPLFERREAIKEEPAPKTQSPASATIAPTGPRNNIPQRTKPFYPTPRPQPSRNAFSKPLPSGWFTAVDQNGNTYYYSKSGQTTWQRPNIPAVETQPVIKAPPKAIQNQKALQDIIDSLTKVDGTSHISTPALTPVVEIPKEKRKKEEKWRSLPVEKQMKIYENTLFPPIKFVMDKFRHKLPKDELKKYAKELGKKLVSSDYKNNRVQDPTRINEKTERKVKKYVKEYLDKAVAKKYAHDKARKARKAAAAAAATSATATTTNGHTSVDVEPEIGIDQTENVAAVEFEIRGEESEVEMSDIDADDIADSPLGNESIPPTPSAYNITPSDENLKRKREDINNDAYIDSPAKKIKDEEDNSAAPSPPPPPPPPPAEGMPDEGEMEGMDLSPMHDVNEQQDMISEADRALAEQEAALMKENEDALIKENEDAMKEEEEIIAASKNIVAASINDEALPSEAHEIKELEVDVDVDMNFLNGDSR